MGTEEDRTKVLKLLPIARGLPDAGTFAKKILGLAPNAWSMIVNGGRFPEARLFILEQDFRKCFLTFEFDRGHLALPPAQFVELFIRESAYPELRRAIKQPAPPDPTPAHPLEHLLGYFCGIYICSDQHDKRKPAVAFDVFQISPSVNVAATARIEQLTYPFGTEPLLGSVRVKRDTIEIQINFANREDPDAIYMAPTPRASEINTLLAIGVDLQHPLRLVTARPTLFVRIPEDAVPRISRMYPAGSPLYAAIEPVFKKCVVIKPKRFQFETKVEIGEEAEDAIRTTLLETLQREAAEASPSMAEATTSGA